MTEPVCHFRITVKKSYAPPGIFPTMDDARDNRQHPEDTMISAAYKQGPFIVYNLFPLLAGPVAQWEQHLDRIEQMGFNWIYINPFHLSGFSGSLYSVKDYYKIDPRIAGSYSQKKAKDALAAFNKKAHDRGIRVMADLVINHTAVDSVLVKSHPKWYEYDDKGKIKNPCAKDGDRVVAVWGDLAEIDNRTSPDRENLWNYWRDLVFSFIDMGFSGFRCDAAYQVPDDLWKFLIGEAKQKSGDVLFFGETLGCTPKQTMQVVASGFDVIFNSSKYWDFKESWCIKQYMQTSPIVPSVSFPESHDTNRLAKELNGNIDRVKLRYTFSAAFSGGVMIPIGFEFGFKNKLHVVQTTPQDWEDHGVDLCGFIGSCNQLKKDRYLFSFDSPMEQIEHPNSKVVVLRKWAQDVHEKALILINDTHSYQEYHNNDLLGSVFAGASDFIDVSPEYPMDFVPNDFHYNLRPYQVKILYAK